jgi:hypothetical protein
MIAQSANRASPSDMGPDCDPASADPKRPRLSRAISPGPSRTRPEKGVRRRGDRAPPPGRPDPPRRLILSLAKSFPGLNRTLANPALNRTPAALVAPITQSDYRYWMPVYVQAKCQRRSGRKYLASSARCPCFPHAGPAPACPFLPGVIAKSARVSATSYMQSTRHGPPDKFSAWGNAGGGPRRSQRGLAGARAHCPPLPSARSSAQSATIAQ